MGVEPSEGRGGAEFFGQHLGPLRRKPGFGGGTAFKVSLSSFEKNDDDVLNRGYLFGSIFTPSKMPMTTPTADRPTAQSKALFFARWGSTSGTKEEEENN